MMPTPKNHQRLVAFPKTQWQKSTLGQTVIIT
jgi:hypothetical protein